MFMYKINFKNNNTADTDVFFPSKLFYTLLNAILKATITLQVLQKKKQVIH